MNKNTYVEDEFLRKETKYDEKKAEVIDISVKSITMTKEYLELQLESTKRIPQYSYEIHESKKIIERTTSPLDVALTVALAPIWVPLDSNPEEGFKGGLGIDDEISLGEVEKNYQKTGLYKNKVELLKNTHINVAIEENPLPDTDLKTDDNGVLRVDLKSFLLAAKEEHPLVELELGLWKATNYRPIKYKLSKRQSDPFQPTKTEKLHYKLDSKQKEHLDFFAFHNAPIVNVSVNSNIIQSLPDSIAVDYLIGLEKNNGLVTSSGICNIPYSEMFYDLRKYSEDEGYYNLRLIHCQAGIESCNMVENTCFPFNKSSDTPWIHQSQESSKTIRKTIHSLEALGCREYKGFYELGVKVVSLN